MSASLPNITTVADLFAARVTRLFGSLCGDTGWIELTTDGEQM